MTRTGKQSRSEWKKLIRQYDARVGNPLKPTLPTNKTKSSTTQSKVAKADAFARLRRQNGSGWAGHRQK